MKLITVIGLFVSAAALSSGPLTPKVQAQCPGDVSHDSVVDGSDLAIVLGAWGSSGALGEDIDGDGIVDGIELAIVLGGWGACPPYQPWATVLEELPDPKVVTDANLRTAIIASGLPWRVRDNASDIEMLLVPPGTFMMGCSASSSNGCFSDENPTHQVTLTSAFYLGRYEVTQAQWLAEMGSNPSYFAGSPDSPSHPVEQVSWNMVQPFCTQNGLRLPTEAEWEYAYRAGTTTALHSMPEYESGTDNDTLLGGIAWYYGNNGVSGSSTYGTKVVGGKFANGFGLHDMSGNVWEWCKDWGGAYAPASVTNPTGPTTGSYRVLRGGSWGNYAGYCRVSLRLADAPAGINFTCGFRVARTP